MTSQPLILNQKPLITAKAKDKTAVSLAVNAKPSLDGVSQSVKSNVTVDGAVGKDAVSLSISPETSFGRRTVSGTVGKDAVSLSVNARASLGGSRVDGAVGKDAVSLSISPETSFGRRRVSGTVGKDAVSLLINAKASLGGTQSVNSDVTVSGTVGKDAMSLSISPGTSFGRRTVSGSGTPRAAVISSLVLD
jgi:hypothetical protein